MNLRGVPQVLACALILSASGRTSTTLAQSCAATDGQVPALFTSLDPDSGQSIEIMPRPSGVLTRARIYWARHDLD